MGRVPLVLPTLVCCNCGRMILISVLVSLMRVLVKGRTEFHSYLSQNWDYLVFECYFSVHLGIVYYCFGLFWIKVSKS